MRLSTASLVSLTLLVVAPSGTGSIVGQDSPPPWSAPPIRAAVSVRDSHSGNTVTLDAMLDQLAQADAVFLGESHDDETTHRLELAVYEGLLERKSQQVVLAMEMFERDVQPSLDDYLAGRIDEQQFLKQSRPWVNYTTSYRPLIELARQSKGSVVASNFPRPLLAEVAARGADAMKGLKPEQAGQVPRELHPNTVAYWRRVDNATRGHQGMSRAGDIDPTARLYSTQSLWDNSMGESCADALDKHPGFTVLHINGGFHSAYWDGTVHQLKLRRPEAKVLTVAIVPTSNPCTAELSPGRSADFVAFVEAHATDVNEGMYSVYGQQQIKYRLHVPTTATPTSRVPLLIFLADDGLTADDGLDLWKERLGDEAAIAVVEAPYRETQEDFGVGGRWFWPDSFTSDVAGLAGAVESIWAYVLRHFPIDPARICVAGEGTGATVAASTALFSDHMELAGVAVAPRQYSRLKEFPLPEPERLADQKPPHKKLLVIGSPQDVQWWSEELPQYRESGLAGETTPRATDPWEVESQEENAIRTALQCPARPTASAGPRRFISVEYDLPRAWQWARLQALRLSAHGTQRVAAVAQSPEAADATPIATDIGAEALAAPGTLPRCPGPFGGTTVVVLPPTANPAQVTAWKAIEENDPLAKASRFYRVRIAQGEGPGALHEVLAKLQSENRKNILIVPAAFFADPNWMRTLRTGVKDLENPMTLQWLPGLGGQPLPLDADSSAASDVPVKHVLNVVLQPDAHQLRVEDKLELPASLARAGTEFTLSAALKVTASQPPLERLADAAGAGPARYRLQTSPPNGVLTLSYEGAVNQGLSDQKEEYTRGFRQTQGMVGTEGVYLDGDSCWVPRFNDALVRFAMDVQLPPQWHVISQGNGTSRDERGAAHWDSHGTAEQVYLVGGPLLRYSDAAGAVETFVYLRAQDDALARRYLDATAQYVEMYRQLIGPYPFGKFALVENFWETGYGMPSFTLLGPQVIRFPFILHSSYPHEILHNWWGNGVLVDYEKGNWCEGLTAYLADHLVQEQRGLGDDYRRSTLQKYRDYVREGRDFPLTEFRERHSAVTEAVGYGKALMLDHMLRRRLGDDAFRSGLAKFYQMHRGQRASFDDLRAAFDESAAAEFTEFFQQWTTRTGAPVLAVANIAVKKTDAGFVVSGLLTQTQDADPYPLQVPITIATANGPQTSIVPCATREQPLSITVDAQPVSLHVDPMCDLFRMLDPRETPASIGQIFGQQRIVAVLPGAVAPARQEAYRKLAEAWVSDTHQIEIVCDKDLAALPDDRCAWILGRENRFAADLTAASPAEAVSLVGESMQLGNETVPLANHSLVVVRRHPRNVDMAWGLIVVDPAAALEGMARKIPHYGKYSYLAFEGAEPTNVVKGQWSTSGSPLVVDLRADRSTPLPALAPEKRPALAELPPVFSARALASHVEFLAAPEREGRGLGSAGLQQAADYIAKQMADIGLQPGGDNGSWFQTFTVPQGPEGKPVATQNVVGVLPGKRADWSNQSIIVSAHYDHLGRGWPDVRDAFRGQVHPGADDNASGVAVMLELARNLAAETGGSRTIVFVAFSAEECGRLGSQHYVAHPRFPSAEIRGVVNLDTVGRLFNGKIAVHAAGTADEWQHVFRGCGYVTGIPNQIVMEGGEASDQQSFIEHGIPAVQIFTGAHGDYHRPSDTPDKVDYLGLVKVATFVKEAIVYLLERPEPLTVKIAAAPSPAAAPGAKPAGDRSVLFGTRPAFDYQGEGAKIEALVPDSPAAQAGLQPGDVILQLDGQKIADLRAFSEALKKLTPNQTVEVLVQRGDARLTVKVTVVKR
jgi:aminopeptidase N